MHTASVHDWIPSAFTSFALYSDNVTDSALPFNPGLLASRDRGLVPITRFEIGNHGEYGRLAGLVLHRESGHP
jgi:hypothetical protein